MNISVNISPEIVYREEFFSFCFKETSFSVQGKYPKSTTFDGKSWFYGTDPQPIDAVAALTATLERADFPATLPAQLIVWWQRWKEGEMTTKDVESKLRSIEGLLEKVSAASSSLN